MVAWYALTLLWSALLLFVAQPMVGKMLLPRFGGTPAVWTTTMLLFQGLLLAGYVYAHLSIRWLGVKRQSILHLCWLPLPWFLLPLAIEDAGNETAGAGALLGHLLAAIGLPVLAVSATAPMIQRWFGGTRHPHAADPYFLYAASNSGSLLALAAYPLLIEPLLGVDAQSRWWRLGYVGFAILVAGAAFLLWRQPREEAQAPSGAADDRPTMGDRAGWVLLSLVPSSAMLGVTTHVTTDIAPTPLLWVIPLTLYLASFVWAFRRRASDPATAATSLVARAFPLAVLAAIPLLFVRVALPAPAMLAVHFGLFALVAVLLHVELANRRPAITHLTEYFGYVGLGGALGGLLNALLAPHLFDSLFEYPLAIAAAATLRPPPDRATSGGSLDRIDAAMLAAIAVVMLIAGVAVHRAHLGDQLHSLLPVYGIPAAICAMLRRRRAFGVGVLILVSGMHLFTTAAGDVLLAERTFFGITRVVDDGDYRVLVHGTTIHGVQRWRPVPSDEPLAYFHREGPLGDVFAEIGRRGGAPRVAVAGLGMGAVAGYGESNWTFRFIEIDPEMARVASDPALFTVIHDSVADVSIAIDDARRYLARNDDRYDLLMLDAFGSDSVPFHLLTREALELYRTRLRAGGLLVFNVTNRYLDLAPVIARLARDLGLQCRARRLGSVTPEDAARFLLPSHFVVVAEDMRSLGALAADPRWTAPTPSDDPPWTDDHTSVIGHLR